MSAKAELEFIAYFMLIGVVYVAAFDKDDITVGDLVALVAVTYIVRRGVD